MEKLRIQLFTENESIDTLIQQKKANGEMLDLFPITKIKNVQGLEDELKKTLKAYDSSQTYNVGDIVVNGNGIYKCNTANTTGNWDGTKWDLVATKDYNELLHKPTDAYNSANTYQVGDVVVYNGSLYKCKTANTTGAWDGTKWDNLISVDISVPTKTSDLTNDGDGTNAFITNATAQISESQVTNLSNDLQNIREVAQGKTETYIIDSQSDITGTKDANDEYTNVTAITGVTIADLQLGDNILIKALQVPDYWVSGLNKTGDVVTSVSLNKLETTKVDLNGYVTGSSLTSDNIVLGNGGSSVKDSGKAVSTAKPVSTSTDNQIPTSKAVYDGLAEKVTSNTAITGATKTKITYDEKGLVTSGADLTESDIPTLSISKTSGLQTALDNKLDDSQLKTSWSSTTSDSNIPSEKLVKDSLDEKLTATTTKVQLTGDVTSSAVSLTNGTASVSTTLANSGVTAGTYSAVQVNAKGIATSGGQVVEIDSGSGTPSSSLVIGGLFFLNMSAPSGFEVELYGDVGDGETVYVQINDDPTWYYAQMGYAYGFATGRSNIPNVYEKTPNYSIGISNVSKIKIGTQGNPMYHEGPEYMSSNSTGDFTNLTFTSTGGSAPAYTTGEITMTQDSKISFIGND